MLTLEEAQRRLMARARPSSVERVPLRDAVGRALDDPNVTAGIDVPAFANSSMDGYALRATDAPGPLRLVGEVTAGMGELPRVGSGTAVRIMTGAPVPPGADSVVPIEDAGESDGLVTVPETVRTGAFVRAAAHDTRAGDTVSIRGRLTPAQVAVLASIGLGEVEVRRRPRVAILSTGDELKEPGDALAPGQIHDANGVALAAAVLEAGGEPEILPRQRDEERGIEEALTAAAERADVVVTSGGVSVGRHDYVRAVLERDRRLDFWRIAVQPGKPLLVGEMGGTTVIGLPGNPVSALVTFELFVRPFIRAMLGIGGDGRIRVAARLGERMPKDAGRRAFLRVVVRAEAGEYHARPAGGQSSSQLRAMADANALLIVPEGADAGEPGEEYEAVLLEAVAPGMDR